LLSRVLGVVRDIFITAQFGTSNVVDAYRAAFAVPDLIYLVVAGGALGTALIPVYQQQQHAHPSAGWKLINAVINMSLPLLVGISVMAWIWAEPLLLLTTARGFTNETQMLAVDLMRILLLQPILLGIGGIIKATLEAHDNFRIPTVGSNLYNIGIIIGVAILAPSWGIYGVVYGVVLGAAIFFVVQIPSILRLGWRWQFAGYKTAGLREIWQLLLPRIFGQSVWQINLAVMISITSTFGVGAVAATGYGMQIMLLPHGLIGLSIGTVMFPLLARLFVTKQFETFASHASTALQSVLAVTLPASVVLFLGAESIVSLLYQRGSFDVNSAALTAQAVRGYALGIAGFSLAEIAVRIWFSLQNTRLPVVVGIITVFLNLSLAWFFTRTDSLIENVFIITLIFSITNTIEAVLLILLLKRQLIHITLLAKPLHLLFSVVGMMVIWQVSRFLLPELPQTGATSVNEWLMYLMHMIVLLIMFVWGVAWGSNGFALMRAARQRAQDEQQGDDAS
ncbi:MAG: murein biosynthesis integral membrane protein MurJ, partial [Chloroflexi bacterium]|nr:murein biosynthesis integral membrane protein MurJ [Chloroflexota bacterium]